MKIITNKENVVEKEVIKFEDVHEFININLGLDFSGYAYFKLGCRFIEYEAKKFKDIRKGASVTYSFTGPKLLKMTINEFEFKITNGKDYSNEWKTFCYKRYGDLYINYCVENIENKQKNLFYQTKKEIEDLEVKIINEKELKVKILKSTKKIQKRIFKRKKDNEDIRHLLYRTKICESNICFYQCQITNKINKCSQEINKIEKYKIDIITFKNNFANTKIL